MGGGGGVEEIDFEISHQKVRDVVSPTYMRVLASALATVFLAPHSAPPSFRAQTKMAAATDTLQCDYLVVGAGASGMSFVDTLLLHAPEPVSVVLLDKREQPGGHWNDAYDFVKLHQPARNYGVESRALEDGVKHPELLASRADILAYYRATLDGWIAKGHKVEFIGNAAFDFDAGVATRAGAQSKVGAGAKVVDARYTENDLPLLVPPRFSFSASRIDLIPPNELPARAEAVPSVASMQRYCVLGAGKTGQDTMLYLRTKLGVPIENIAWVMPTDPWITARDPPSPRRQNTCMEFISTVLEAHDAAGSPPDAATTADFLQRGFERAEQQGLVYRLDPAVRPTKFMDATLNQEEVGVLRGCSACVMRGHGRVAAIGDDGVLTFADGSVVPLPWAAIEGAATTTFVHCTAGAFNFGASAAEARRPVFGSDGRITVQEIFQFPGFCFNGAVIGWLECQRSMSLDEKNELCELPPPNEEAPGPLGPVAGDVGALGAGHPLMVSLRNLRRWYAAPGMGAWLHSLRLFSLRMNGYTLEEGRDLVERNHAALVKAGVLD